MQRNLLDPQFSTPARTGPAARWQDRLQLPAVAALLATYALLWSLLLAATRLSPPTDTVEQWTWAHALAWGYYKHPPLPTWILWAVSRVAGLDEGTVTALGAATVAATFAMFWSLLRRLRGTAWATVATLAALCISYYNGRLDYYNHEVVLMAAATACAATLERALATRRLAWWLGVGACLGLGALAKYQIVVTVACLAVAVVRLGTWRDPVQRRGLTAAGVVASLIVLPHAVWLAHQHDGPIQYALATSVGVALPWAARIGNTAHFVADQLFNRALPGLLLLAGVAWTLRRRGAAPAAAPPGTADAARVLLLAWGWVPLAFTAVLGLATGMELQLHWGESFLLFTMPALMELARPVRWQDVPGSTLARLFAALQAAVALACVLSSPHGPNAWRDHHWRQFDSTRLAADVGPPMRDALGGPVRVLSGPATITEALALRLPERPRVLVDGNYGRSPWVTPEQVERCGVVRLIVAPQALPHALAEHAPLQLAWSAQRPRDGAAPCDLGAP